MMKNLVEDSNSLTDFKRRTSIFLGQLRKSGQPLVLTVKGKAQLVVQDAGSYQDLLDLIDRLEAIEGIKKGLKDAKHGRTRSIQEVASEKQRKYGL